jgi:hypothetical protein
VNASVAPRFSVAEVTTPPPQLTSLASVAVEPETVQGMAHVDPLSSLPAMLIVLGPVEVITKDPVPGEGWETPEIVSL